MATMPPAADPSAAAPADSSQAAPDASSGFTVELNVAGDGSMTVSVEPAAADQGDGGAADGGEESAQPVPNLAAAFKLIKEIVSQGGQMADAGAGQDQMSGGYASTGM